MNSLQDQKFIYFEKQGADMMCGVHCINALLQGPYFDEITMSNIAQQLDQKERELMMEGGMNNKDFLKFMQEASNNVANDGNFSMQVLSEALKSFGEYQAIPVENPEVKRSITDYGLEEGYICHSVDHWIAIRKLYGTWFNLNSTNMFPPGPQIISDFYLAAFLDSIKNSGYTIFVVRGSKPLPMPNKQNMQGFSSYQHYVPLHQIEAFQKDNKNRGLNAGGADERELEEALQRSLKESKAQGNNDDDDDESAPMVGTVLNRKANKQEEEKKFQAFKGQGVSLGGPSKQDVVMSEADAMIYEGFGDDPELAMAIKLSMLEEEAKQLVVPDEPTDEADPSTFANLQLRLKDGKTLKRRFFHNNTIQDVINYIKKETQNYGSDVVLKQSFPRKTFDNGSQTLWELNIKKNETLIVDM